MNAQLSNYQQTEIEKLKNTLKKNQNLVRELRESTPLDAINSEVSSRCISRMSSVGSFDSDIEEELQPDVILNFVIATEASDMKKAFYSLGLKAKLNLDRKEPA